jgi:hypothetical protein
MRIVFILIIFTLLVGCMTVDPACYKVKEFIVPDKTCGSGYVNGLTAITGHPATCLLPNELIGLQKECPNWR